MRCAPYLLYELVKKRQLSCGKRHLRWSFRCRAIDLGQPEFCQGRMQKMAIRLVNRLAVRNCDSWTLQPDFRFL